MNGIRTWLWAAAAAAAAVPAAAAGDPPSVKVNRWYEHFCPRDLTPQVCGPFFGYHETRWRVMPSAVPPTVLPPISLMSGGLSEPAPGPNRLGRPGPAAGADRPGPEPRPAPPRPPALGR